MRGAWSFNHRCCRCRIKNQAKLCLRCWVSVWMRVVVWPALRTCRLGTVIRMLLWEQRLRCWRRAALLCLPSTSVCTTARSLSSSCWPKALLSICLMSILTMSPARAVSSRRGTLMTALMCCLSLTPTSSLLLSALPWRRRSCSWRRAHRRCTTCTKLTVACMRRLVCATSTRF